MLKLSWKLRNEDMELLSYDLIGKNFYYLDQIEMAIYFHNKSTNDDREPIESNIRKVGEH